MKTRQRRAANGASSGEPEWSDRAKREEAVVFLGAKERSARVRRRGQAGHAARARGRMRKRDASALRRGVLTVVPATGALSAPSDAR